MDLFPYQVEGIEWLKGKRFALLADEMGVGKTVQAIKAAEAIGASQITVLCPAVARYNWAAEFKTWSKTEASAMTLLYSASDAQRTLAPITICSYDLASRPSVLARLRRPGGVLILDEAHYLKSVGALRSSSVFGSAGLARIVDRVWALTGTPAPNNASELWIMLRCFGAPVGEYQDFIDRYCTVAPSPYGYEPRIVGTKVAAIPELRKLLEPLMLRRKKADVLKELPPIYYGNMLEVEASPVDMVNNFPDYYLIAGRTGELAEKLRSEHAVLKSAVEKTTGIKDMEPRAELLASLQKSVATYRRYVGLQKMPAIAKLLSDELDSGAYEKIVVFAVHQGVIEGLRSRLAEKYGAVTLYGKTDPDTRIRNIEKFQRNPKCRVFIANIQAAGTAINLTAAHNVLVAESDWVPGNNAQAIMRCHRIGQTHPVYVRFCSLVNDPLDANIQRLLRRKARELTEILDVKSHMRIFE